MEDKHAHLFWPIQLNVSETELQFLFASSGSDSNDTKKYEIPCLYMVPLNIELKQVPSCEYIL